MQPKKIGSKDKRPEDLSLDRKIYKRKNPFCIQ